MIASRIVMRFQFASDQSISTSPHLVFVPPVTSLAAWIMNLTQELIIQAAKDVTGGTKTKWGEVEIDWSEANWKRRTMREAIIHYWPERDGEKPELSDFASHDSVKKLVERFNAAHAHVAYDPNEPPGKTIANLFE